VSGAIGVALLLMLRFTLSTMEGDHWHEPGLINLFEVCAGALILWPLIPLLIFGLIIRDQLHSLEISFIVMFLGYALLGMAIHRAAPSIRRCRWWNDNFKMTGLLTSACVSAAIGFVLIVLNYSPYEDVPNLSISDGTTVLLGCALLGAAIYTASSFIQTLTGTRADSSKERNTQN